MAMWVLTPPFYTSADRIGVGILSDLCWVRLLALLQEGKRPAGLLRVLEPNGFSSFVVQTIGYKYVFISTLPTIYLPHETNLIQVIAALSGVLAILSIPFMHETYAPVIRMRRDLASGDPERIKNARRYLGPEVQQLGRWKFLWTNLSRPVVLLTRSLICFVLSLYMALLYGIYYLMFATFSGP